MVERVPWAYEVVGSSPAIQTNFKGFNMITPLTKVIPMVSMRSTLDGRLKRNQIYAVRIVDTPRGLRAQVIVDERKSTHIFDPRVFRVPRAEEWKKT